MYQFSTRVGYSQIDPSGRLTPGAMINLFQDCANFHSLDVGAGPDYFERLGKVWVLSAWQIVIDSYPEMGDALNVFTSAYDFTPMFGMRNFMLQTSEGLCAVKANSYWVLLDIALGTPVRVTKEDGALYGSGEKPLEMEYAPRKILIPKELEQGKPVRVMRSHLDTNHHMNNCHYVKLAMEYLPENFDLRQVRVEYKISARYGDVIVPFYHLEEQGLTVVLKNQRDGGIFATVSLERRKQECK